ncbi:hypothetical protein PHMEG_00013833 [Phytophthora megakarya]|uniref:Uncharacterized protein n=1 Tax=Phytophthora megakarya TaxID=4795 RepID=A0A225W5A5_9STRA|nr:hypothetical protein PHMEG_00013833 [Phytophthora megakarya]
MHRQLRESLSERLRSEVQISAALWQIKHNDENVVKSDAKGVNANSQRSIVDGFPCPREVKPLLYFYKYLQPIGAGESVPTNDDSNTSAPANHTSQKKLRVNLPLTVVCERNSAQEMVLWLRTDAQGNVIRDEKTPLWRKKLHNELLGPTGGSARNLSENQENDPVLAVRSVARWKNTNKSNGGSAVVLTRTTLDPVIAIPCELPICVQQFVRCRGSQPSVYRIFWCEQERKCFAVNLTSRYSSVYCSFQTVLRLTPSWHRCSVHGSLV